MDVGFGDVAAELVAVGSVVGSLVGSFVGSGSPPPPEPPVGSGVGVGLGVGFGVGVGVGVGVGAAARPAARAARTAAGAALRALGPGAAARAGRGSRSRASWTDPPARVVPELLAAVGGPGLTAYGPVAVIGGSAPVMLPTGMPLTGMPSR